MVGRRCVFVSDEAHEFLRELSFGKKTGISFEANRIIIEKKGMLINL